MRLSERTLKVIRRQLKESPHPLQAADTKDWQIPWPKWRDTVLYTTFTLTLKDCRGPMNRRKSNKSRFFPWLITRRPLVTSHLAKVHHRQSVIKSARTGHRPCLQAVGSIPGTVGCQIDVSLATCVCLHRPPHGSRELRVNGVDDRSDTVKSNRNANVVG